MLKWLCFISVFGFYISSCNREELETHTSHVERGFYHWKSDFILSEEQNDFLENIETDVLYVRYFDVDWNGDMVAPEAVVGKVSPCNIPIVPTVFITNEVFVRTDSIWIPELADNIASKIRAIHGQNSYQEIQIDCDWTPSTRLKYFYFLTEFKKHFQNTTISSTIRLYQYKYPDLAGVPPVDKGMLMYYNMGDLKEYKEINSILNNEKGEQYLGFNEYVLPLDIALPNFSWGLKFRGQEFQYICPGFLKKELMNPQDFVFLAPNRFVFLHDTVMHDNWFRYGDELRYESCSKTELLKAAKMLKAEMNQDTTRIIFYDLQPNTPNDYEKLDAVFSIFEQ